MKMASTALIRFPVALVCLSALTHHADAQTLTRDTEPVVVTASSHAQAGAFQSWIDVSTDRIHLYRFSPGAGDPFVPIPFQIDRKKLWNLRNNCPATLDFQCAAWRPPDRPVPDNCERTYDFDPNGDPAAGVLSDRDEVVFLARDAGPRAPDTTVWKSGDVSTRRYEIEVEQWSGSQMVGVGYVYAFLYASTHPFELPSPYYVKWTTNTSADQDRPADLCIKGEDTPRGSKACGLFEKGPQFDTVLSSKATYRARFIGNWINNRLWPVPPGSSSPNAEMIDRVKWRASTETEALWSNCVCPRFLGLKVGPVRVIRLVQGAASGYMTTRTDYLYATHAHTIVRLRVHPGVSDIEHFVDYHSARSGAKLYTDSGGDGEGADQDTIDGVNIAILAAYLDWTQVNTPEGRLVHFFEETRPMNAGTPSYAYTDSAETNDPPEFEGGAYGNHGETFSGPTALLQDAACVDDPTDPNANYGEMQLRTFIRPVSGTESAADAVALQAELLNPLRVVVTPQDYTVPPPAPPIPGCGVTLESSNPNNGRYLDLTPNTGSPGSPCPDSTVAFIAFRAIGTGEFAYLADIPKGTTFRDFSVYRGATYRYQVRSRNSAGALGPVSNIVTLTASDTEPPAVPSAVTIASSDHAVTLLWDPSTTRDIHGFNVYLATVPGGPYTRANSTLVPAAKLDFKAGSLINGIPYYAVVRAEDWAGNLSGESIEVSGVPGP